MKKGAFNFFEMHVEKLALGACGAFALAMAWLYMVNTPNTVEYKGESVTPRELDSRIRTAAEQMQSRARAAKPPEVQVPRYAQDLRKEQDAGVIGAPVAAVAPPSGAANAEASPAVAPPPVPERLRLATNFGQKVEVPGLEELVEAPGQVSVVRPLAPLTPAARTGRSMVLHAAPPPSAARTGGAAGGDVPVEAAWVSVAGYFDREAQQKEMSKGGYAPYRSKVYLAGVDLQRQEVQSNGEFGEWKDVAPSKTAGTEIELVEPVFDDKTGAMLNKEAVDRAFQAVKSNQRQIMQPPFHEVTAGDTWDVPPIPGFEDEGDSSAPDSSDSDAAKKRREERLKRQKELAAARRSSRAGGGAPMAFGGRGGGVFGGRGGARGMGEGIAPPVAGGGGGGGSNRAALRKQLNDQLKEAETAMKDKDWGRARSVAESIATNPEADAGMINKAERIIEEASKKLGKEGGGGAPTGEGMAIGGRGGGRGVPMSEGGGRGIPMAEGGGRGYPAMGRTGGAPAPSASTGENAEPEYNPKNKSQVVVWAHDDTVEAGKTYRYRMRVKLWNRYVGQPRPLRDPTAAALAVLPGDWSLPTEPVTVAPSTHFFLSSGRTDKTGARVEVFKWREGKYVRRSFDVGVGDVIGGVVKLKKEKEKESGESASGGEGDRKTPVFEDVDFSTGAVVLDLRFDEPVEIRQPGPKGEFTYRSKPQLIMVYLEPADGQVKERVLEIDKYDPLYKKLRESESG